MRSTTRLWRTSRGKATHHLPQVNITFLIRVVEGADPYRFIYYLLSIIYYLLSDFSRLTFLIHRIFSKRREQAPALYHTGRRGCRPIPILSIISHLYFPLSPCRGRQAVGKGASRGYRKGCNRGTYKTSTKAGEDLLFYRVLQALQIFLPRLSRRT